MTRVLIIGKNGRIGGALKRRFATHSCEVAAWGRKECDLSRIDSLEAALKAQPADLIINAAAITKVDLCEDEPELAHQVNCLAPGRIAEFCNANGCRFVHISTDYVFDGKQPGMRTESEATHPLSVYGQTKRAGEKAVLDAFPDALVVRTSWVFGPERPSFPDMILDRALQQDSVSAICNKWSSPCYSEDFSDYLRILLKAGNANGVVHLCNSGSCSWYDYAQATLDMAVEMGYSLRCRQLDSIQLDDMKAFTAERPIHTAMSTERFQQLTGVTPRHWQEALRDYLHTHRPLTTHSQP